MNFLSQLTRATILLTVFIASCAQLDQWTKPSVNGLYIDPEFTPSALSDGGISKLSAENSLDKQHKQTDSLTAQLTAAIRQKRPDLQIKSDGFYEIKASIIADDVSNSTDELDKTVSKWSTRSIKANYIVYEANNEKQVWSGIIETSDQTLAEYDKKTDQKKSDKIIDAVTEVLTNQQKHPYPTPPTFSNVVRSNFEGFALNLPKLK